MPQFSSLLEKLANGRRLSGSEILQLRDDAKVLEDVMNLVPGWVRPGTSIPIFGQSLIPLYDNKPLPIDTASISINVPPIVNTVLLFGSGSITSANGGNIWAQFNDDTASNYEWQFIKGDGATVSSTHDTSDPYVALGVFGTTGAGAGVNGSFESKIVHCQGSWKKNILSHTYTAEFNDLYLLGGTWQSTDPIRKIEIFGTDNTLAKGTTNLAAGSLFTAWGLL